ncbi:MAG: HNH endonuclease [Planctomycetes bacterium]|nr:HNH endonuclease [Planctomycetota bacterium]
MDPALEREVWARANGTCEYCRMPQACDVLRFQVDHIVARKHGGSTEPSNTALACYACNAFKGPNIAGIDPVSKQVVQLFHPRRDHWGDHFEWHGALLVGRTPSGRATIAVLQINLPQRVAVRRQLIAEGAFRTA